MVQAHHDAGMAEREREVKCLENGHFWSEWGPCSEECGAGVRTRYRDINCEGLSVDVENCEERPCKSPLKKSMCLKSSGETSWLTF